MKVSSSAQPDDYGPRRHEDTEPKRILRASVTPWLVAVIYLALHIPFLAPSLEDIDSINFALGLREFNPALHQPHPPGYPVYMVMGHVSLAIVERVSSMTRVSAEAWSLAVWSAIGGAGCIIAVWFFFAALAERSGQLPTSNSQLSRSRDVAASGSLGVGSWKLGIDAHEAGRAVMWATLLLAASPLFWMSGLRPMSDLPGLALAIGAQALLLRRGPSLGRRSSESEGGRSAIQARLIQGALLAAIAAGIRVQTAVLTVPVLAFVLLEQRNLKTWWRPVAAFAAGCLAWGVPLVVASGGIDAYLAALHSQAGEDFAWVDMLWATPTPRHFASALYQTLVLPWASIPLAVAVTLAAAIGALVMLLREWRALLLLVIAFVPYLAFHLLFQETITVRYALPVLPAIAWLAARGIALAGRFTAVVAVPFVVSALIVAVPGAAAYGRDPHPAFRAIADAVQRARVQPPAAVYSHYGVRRPLQAADTGPLHIVEPRTNYEWLGLVDYWRGGGTAPVWFFADERRTDLALIDPQSRHDVVRYRWTVEQRPELSGTRPLGVDWYRLPVPGWFTGQGWSLTPETGGITQATAMGPDHRPIEAFVRRRPGAFHLVVGGRHLGNEGDADAELELAVDGARVDRWTLPFKDRNFVRFIDLPQGIAGPGAFASLTISSRSLNPAQPAPVAIRQFDIQPAAQMIYGYGEGWHEEEFTVETGLKWRWTSERSVVQIKGPSQPVQLTLSGESPLRYLDAPPTVKVTAGGATIAQFQPDADFEWTVTVPAEELARSGGAVAIETDRVYLPGPAEGTADTRHLGLRIYDFRVTPVSP